MNIRLAIILIGFFPTLFFVSPTFSASMLRIEEGEYVPLYLKEGSPKEQVDAFLIDELPVSNQDFFDFIQKKPEWSKSATPAIFNEATYLQHWQQNKTPLAPQTNDLNKPVVNVSWFAAQAYCKDLGKRLPSTKEWEYVASASDKNTIGNTEPSYNQKILEWYGKPNLNDLKERGQSTANFWGVKDLHGLIWEWTSDFNSNLVNGESRADSSIDQSLFCGAGALGASGPEDYAAFMRLAFRSSLQAKFTLGNLGFRCADDL